MPDWRSRHIVRGHTAPGVQKVQADREDQDYQALPEHLRLQEDRLFHIPGMPAGPVEQIMSQLLFIIPTITKNPKIVKSRNRSFILPRVHTKQGESAFSYYAAHSWNQLPEEIRCAKTLATFKSRLKTHLFSCAFTD